MTMSCSYARPSTSIDPNPRSRTSITYRPYPPPARTPTANPRLLADNLVAECRPRILGLVDGDREDHLALADRHFQQTLDVHACVGEFPPELGRFSGLVCALDLQGGTLGELQARALQRDADGGLVAGDEHDGPALAGHHTGKLK